MSDPEALGKLIIAAMTGDITPSSRALPSSANDGHPLDHDRVANPTIEEPDAVESARPDLWGAEEAHVSRAWGVVSSFWEAQAQGADGSR